MVSVGQERLVFAPECLSGVSVGRLQGCGWNHWKGHAFTCSRCCLVSAGDTASLPCRPPYVITLHGMVWASSQHGSWFPKASIPPGENQADAIFFLSPSFGSHRASLLVYTICQRSHKLPAQIQGKHISLFGIRNVSHVIKIICGMRYQYRYLYLYLYTYILVQPSLKNVTCRLLI